MAARCISTVQLDRGAVDGRLSLDPGRVEVHRKRQLVHQAPVKRLHGGARQKVQPAAGERQLAAGAAMVGNDRPGDGAEAFIT